MIIRKAMRVASTTVTAALVIFAVAGAAPMTALAQTEQTPPTSAAQTGSGESLSGKLSKSGGIIKPNNSIDPGIGIAAPDPHPNSTPVIPPSATGGATAK